MALRLVVATLILLIPGALLLLTLLLLVSQNQMIRIKSRRAQSEPIEWADRLKLNPIAWIVTCPWCQCDQWVSLKHLYVGKDRSKRNYQCKHCSAGTEPRGGWDKTKAEEVFKPKCPGWRSIYK